MTCETKSQRSAPLNHRHIKCYPQKQPVAGSQYRQDGEVQRGIQLSSVVTRRSVHSCSTHTHTSGWAAGTNVMKPTHTRSTHTRSTHINQTIILIWAWFSPSPPQLAGLSLLQHQRLKFHPVAPPRLPQAQGGMCRSLFKRTSGKHTHRHFTKNSLTYDRWTKHLNSNPTGNELHSKSEFRAVFIKVQTQLWRKCLRKGQRTSALSNWANWVNVNTWPPQTGLNKRVSSRVNC